MEVNSTGCSERILTVRKKIKAFERQFEKENGRNPTINDASVEMSELIREYQQLKTMLECSKGNNSKKYRSDSTARTVSSEQAVEGNPVVGITSESLVQPPVKSSIFSKALNKESVRCEGSAVVLPSMSKLRSWKKSTKLSNTECRSECGEVVVEVKNSKGDLDTAMSVGCLVDVNSDRGVETCSDPLVMRIPGVLTSRDQPHQKPVLSAFTATTKSSLSHRKLSSSWLESCKPNLKDFPSNDSKEDGMFGDDDVQYNNVTINGGGDEDIGGICDCDDEKENGEICDCGDDENGEVGNYGDGEENGGISDSGDDEKGENSDSSDEEIGEIGDCGDKKGVISDGGDNENGGICVCGEKENRRISDYGIDGEKNGGIIDCGEGDKENARICGSDEKHKISDWEGWEECSDDPEGEEETSMFSESISSALTSTLSKSQSSCEKSRPRLSPRTHLQEVQQKESSPSSQLLVHQEEQDLAELYSVDSNIYSTIRCQDSDLVTMLRKRPREHYDIVSEVLPGSKVTKEDTKDSDEGHDVEPKVKKLRNAMSKPGQTSDVSQNFVRLNMKIKRYKRKGQSGSQKYKKHRFGRGKNACYKCGAKGHWARDCPTSKNLGTFDGEEVEYCDDGQNSETSCASSVENCQGTNQEDEKTHSNDNSYETSPAGDVCASGSKHEPVHANCEESSSLPVKKAERKTTAKKPKSLPSKRKSQRQDVQATCDEPSREESTVFQVDCNASEVSTVQSLYSVDDDISDDLRDVLKKFGFVDFRPGQRKVIERILTGRSTLFVQSTGSGKSLCYQVPAYLYWKQYKAITLVVSPLVSLMEDQVKNLPRCLRGACLHSNMDPRERQTVLEQIKSGSIAVLLISPEAVVGDRGASFWTALSYVAFVCIDEVHCVSQWSHNFRPAYLRICKIFWEHCHVSCFLGLTATATKSTIQSVAAYLKLPEEGIVQGQILPPNLYLSVSSDNDKDMTLLHLLQREPFKSCESIIIYCTRQQTTERVAQSIRTCLQSLDSFTQIKRGAIDTKNEKKKLEIADCYHAGMSGAVRSRIQNKFMSGRLRIVVATVAFGMGLNKSDVRAIIHYNMPRSFESYVQEIGRAGRDGEPAYCHVFLDVEGEDMNELRRHIHANSVDRFAIKQLVKQLAISPVPSCSVCDGSSMATGSTTTPSAKRCHSGGHFVALNIAECVSACDVKEETLMTYLCYLEFEGWIELHKTARDTCVLQLYGGASQLRRLTQRADIIAAAVECSSEQERNDQSKLSFSVSAVCNRVGKSWQEVQKILAMLQYDDLGSGESGSKRSSVLVEFQHPSYIISVRCNYTPQDMDAMCNFLHDRVQQQETSDLMKLQLLHNALRKALIPHTVDPEGDSDDLRCVVKNYFSDKLQAPQMKSTNELLQSLTDKQNVRICRDIRTFLAIHEDHQLTARAIARIFHGISSPNFPAEVWGRERRFWRAYIDVDFHVLRKLAQEQIIAF